MPPTYRCATLRCPLDEQAELTACAPGRPRLERVRPRHHQRDDRCREVLAERERPDDRDERDRVDADVPAQQRPGRRDDERDEDDRRTGRPDARRPNRPRRRARAPPPATIDAERDRRQPSVPQLPSLLWEEGRVVDGYQLFASVRSCGRATRMRASTTTAPSGRPIDGIEVELGELGEVVGELREPEEDVREGGRVGGGSAAEARDEPARLPRTDELVGVDVRQGREPEVRVADQLREHPAGAEGDERAEDGILRHSRQELDATRDHRLHDHGAADPLGGGRTASASARSRATPPRLRLVRPRRSRLHDAG